MTETSAEAEDSPAKPKETPTDISLHETRDRNPPKSDDTCIKGPSGSLEAFLRPPDLDFTLRNLVGVPNDIIKEHYGERVHFLAVTKQDPYTMIWSIKTDNSFKPFATLTRTKPDGKLLIFKSQGKNHHDRRPEAFEERGVRLFEIAKAIQAACGCNQVSFYDGENFVLFTFSPGTKKGFFITVARENDGRCRLMIWLGEGIINAKVMMLKPLTGYTLEDSNVQALGLISPPQRLINDSHIDMKLLLGIKAKFGGSEFKMYTMQDGTSRIITVEDCPLPTVDDQQITTAAGVRKSAQAPLTDFLVEIAKDHVGNPLKFSYDLLPDALVFYVRKSKERTKEFIGILQFAPAGTIVPGDWGMRNKDLTFTNGEGIVRTAKPLFDSILLLGQQQECFCMALFDYHNLVLVTRSMAGKVYASMVLIAPGRIRGALMQWLLRALEIAEETFPAVE